MYLNFVTRHFSLENNYKLCQKEENLNISMSNQ